MIDGSLWVRYLVLRSYWQARDFLLFVLVREKERTSSSFLLRTASTVASDRLLVQILTSSTSSTVVGTSRQPTTTSSSTGCRADSIIVRSSYDILRTHY